MSKPTPGPLTNTPETGPAPLDFAAARDFLERRFGDEHHGHMILAFFPVGGGPPRHKSVPLQRENRWGLAESHLRAHAETHDCYVGVANYAKTPTAKAQRTETMIDHLNALYCERDAAPLAPQLPAPTLTVETSDGRFQDYWHLDKPTDVATAKAYIRRIADACGIRPEAVDAARILRVPGTRNHKPKHHGEIVRVVAASDRRYDLAAFDHLPALAAMPPIAPAPAIATDGERVPAARLVQRALERAGTEGRNGSGFWLASQLRDNGYSEMEAEGIGLADYVPSAPRTTPDGAVEDYPEREYRASVRQAYRRAPRERWASGPVEGANGRTVPRAGSDVGHAPTVTAATGSPPPSPGTGEGSAPEPAHGERLNDVANARRFALQHGGDVRYCHPLKTWFVWDDRRWRRDTTGEVVRRAKRTAASIYHEAAEAAQIDAKAGETVAKWAQRSHAKERLDAMLALAQSEEGVYVEPGDLDAEPWLFTCENGTIDLRTGNLGEHCRDHLITKLCPVPYEPDATFPLWDEFLDKATKGDTAYRAFLQRAAGYSLTGDTGEEVLFFVHGPAATGKSTYLEAKKATLGEYATTADFEAFLSRSHVGAPRNDIAQLAGARFVVSIEVDEGKKLAEGLVKQLTGGDTVRARFLYQEAFEFKPALKLWLAANHAPQVRDDDEAMWRRILRLPFTQTIPKAERKKEVKAALCNPTVAGPAILAWMVEGCLAWQRDGLGVPQAVDEATASYRLEMDPLTDFISDCCVLHRDARVSVANLSKAYQDYSRENDEDRPLARKEFAERLERRGCIPGKSGNIRLWKGIGLLTSEPVPQMEEFTLDFQETNSGDHLGHEGHEGHQFIKSTAGSDSRGGVSENRVPSVPSVPLSPDDAPSNEDVLWQWFVNVRAERETGYPNEVRRAASRVGFTFDTFKPVEDEAARIEEHLNRRTGGEASRG